MAGLIEVSDVTFGYGRGAHFVAILEDLDLDIEPGEILCLLGPSGCGKTSLLRLIAGFEFPTSGRITVGGGPVRAPGADRGVVFQGEDSLFHWLRAIDNVAFALRLQGMDKRERLQVASRFLDLVGLKGQDRKYPGELSGGMKQRIQIARVLASDPTVLLMDEPFAALDAQTRSELQDELVRIWQETGKTILFITHDIAEAVLLGTRIAVMGAGPGSRIRELIEVRLPSPRRRGSAEFGELYEAINGMIKDEVRGRGEVSDVA